METLDSALRAGGLIQREEDLPTDFDHANNFVLVDLHSDIQIPDDKEKTQWTCEINGTEGNMIATEKPATGWLDIQSEGKVFCTCAPGEEITVKIKANGSPFLWGSFTAKAVDYMGSPGFTFLIESSMMFLHVVNVEGRGYCIGAASVQTDHWVN